MGRVDDVINALGTACTTAINNAGITVPSQGYQGWPSPGELVEILNQNQYAYSLYPLRGGKRLPPRSKGQSSSTIPTPTIIVTVPPGPISQIVFSGTPEPCNLNFLIGHPTLGTQLIAYQVNSLDTFYSISNSLTNTINSRLSPIVAELSGFNITITGATSIKCNVGMTGTIKQNQSRFSQRIQVSVWTSSAYQNTGNTVVDTPVNLRSAVCDAIVNSVGTDMNMWYSLPDGTDLRMQLESMPTYRDDSQVDYNVYEATMVYLVEYVLQSSVQATQVGVIEELTAINGLSPILTVGG